MNCVKKHFRRVTRAFLALFALTSFAVGAVIEISSFDDLRKIGGGDTGFPLDGGYVLANNIDASNSRVSAFTPIGSYEKPFTGTFDGKGFYVQGLYINRPNSGYTGLFGHIGRGASVSNLGVLPDTVTGLYAVGALAGGSDGAVAGCYVKGGVVRANRAESNAGGLVGVNGGTVRKSYSTASVIAKENAGGLAGLLASIAGGEIAESYSVGQVSGVSRVGGLVGYVFGGAITDCYSAGMVESAGNGKAGGLVGADFGAENGDYKTVGRTGAGGSPGGSVRAAVVSGCYWNIETSGQPKSAGGAGLADGDMGNADSFAGWDFSGTWAFTGGARYPHIAGLPGYMYKLSYAAGEGGKLRIDNGAAVAAYDTTVEHGRRGPPITVAPDAGRTFAGWSDGVTSLTRTDGRVAGDIAVTARFSRIIRLQSFEDLLKIGNEPDYPLSGYYELARNIDASGSRGMNGGAGFEPIGARDSAGFAGVFNGRGYTISQLRVNRPESARAGLFAVVGKGGEVRDVFVAADTVSGKSVVGILAGENHGVISNCRITGGSVECGDDGGESFAGGLAGVNGGVIMDCRVMADSVAASGDFVGGLAGLNGEGALIANSHSAAPVSGGRGLAGGFAGANRGRITGGSYTGLVSASGGNTGGFAGLNEGSISESRSAGRVSVSGPAAGVGGFAGNNYENASLAKCFSTSFVSNGHEGGENTGGLAGRNSGAITECYSSGIVMGYRSVGGLVGRNAGAGAVARSYSIAPVSGHGMAGGLAGTNEGSITQCYAAGSVKLTDEGQGPADALQGGLIGESRGGAVAQSYWDEQATGQTASNGGPEGEKGETTAGMQARDTYAGWNFASVWAINPGMNGGYPYLRSLESSLKKQAGPSGPIAMKAAPMPKITVKGKTLRVAQTPPGADLRVTIYDLRGRAVYRANAKGGANASIRLDRMPAGRYVVELRDGKKLAGRAAFVLTGGR